MADRSGQQIVNLDHFRGVHEPVNMPSPKFRDGGTGGGDMSDTPTREEVREIIGDKLATAEARSDAKLTEINGKIDRLSDQIGILVGHTADLKDDAKNTRITVIVTAIASVLAIVSILLAAQGNLLSAFQTGLTAVQTVHSNDTPAQQSAPPLGNQKH